ncbi:MAG: hypothetical protein Q9162_005918 [Coniocarpon cinnabarinum]
MDFNVTMPTGDEFLTMFQELSPLIPTYVHILVAALFPIFAGAHASLTRPSTAAKPSKKHKNDAEASDEGEDEDAPLQHMEGMSTSDAILFPITAALMLTGLYFLIKWLEDPQILNKILNYYFASFALFGVARIISDGLDVVHSLAFPQRYSDGEGLWQVKTLQRQTRLLDGNGQIKKRRNSPLPGPFAQLRLPEFVLNVLWFLKSAPNRKFTFKIHLHRIISADFKLGIHGIEGLLIGLITVFYYNFIAKPWPVTNLIGFAFAYGAMQILTPTKFATGSLLLAALFVYDIYMVFYTPMMVSVAKNLEIPGKLEFPRPEEGGKIGLAMLGLGDVVLPGIFIGLALRFDLWLHYLRLQKSKTPDEKPSLQHPEEEAESDSKQQDKTKQDVSKAEYTNVTGHWGERLWTSTPTMLLTSLLTGQQISTSTKSGQAAQNVSSDNKELASHTRPAWRFRKPYLTATLTGYIAGMVTTLLAMQISGHPQPALLYLVPGVIGAFWITAWMRREIGLALEFSESEDEEAPKQKQKEGHSESKDKEGAQSIWDSLGRMFAGSKSGTENGKTRKGIENKKEGDRHDAEQINGSSVDKKEQQANSSKEDTKPGQESHDDSRPWLKVGTADVFKLEVRLPPSLPQSEAAAKKDS